MQKPIAFVIEDHRDIVIGFVAALEQAGYEVETAHDGAVALERLNEFTPHLIILDMQLPNVNGMDILKEIRASDRLQNTVVLIASAYSRRLREVETQVKDGTTLTLLKPVHYIQLKELATRFYPVL